MSFVLFVVNLNYPPRSQAWQSSGTEPLEPEKTLPSREATIELEIGEFDHRQIFETSRNVLLRNEVLNHH